MPEGVPISLLDCRSKEKIETTGFGLTTEQSKPNDNIPISLQPICGGNWDYLWKLDAKEESLQPK